MSVAFHSPREKVYNKICSFVALYPDFSISAVNLKLSITEIYAKAIDSDFPRQRHFFLTYKATAGSFRNDKQSHNIPPFEGLFHDLPQRERELVAFKLVFKNTVIDMIHLG